MIPFLKPRNGKTPASVDEEPTSGYWRLDSQIRWYDQKSTSAQRNYKTLKMVEIACAASIPLAATLQPVVASILGVAIVVLEGLQHLNQWHHNWITFRSTCEELRHEKFCFLEKAGPYADLDAVHAKHTLVERIESLISTEHSKWVMERDQAHQRLHDYARPRSEERGTTA